jgi:uncharacterized protein involved in exopolysaccharide biosynthesis
MGKLILDEFELRPLFKTRNEDDALGTLRGRTSLRYTDDGLFLVGYEDKDAKRAADIVNGYVRHLDEIIQQVNSGRAGQTRMFVEKQIARCNTDLQRSEEAMRDFQRQHQRFRSMRRPEGAIGLAAELQGRILAAEVELELLKQRALPASQEVQQKSRELQALKTQYMTLAGGKTPVAGAGEQDDLFPQFASVPDLALQYMRLMRDLKVQETLYALLVQQLEQARIEEQKKHAVLSVLDYAEPTSRPVFPRKMLMILGAALAAALWVSIIAVLVEKLRRRRAPAGEVDGFDRARGRMGTAPGWVHRLERLVR